MACNVDQILYPSTDLEGWLYPTPGILRDTLESRVSRESKCFSQVSADVSIDGKFGWVKTTNGATSNGRLMMWKLICNSSINQRSSGGKKCLKWHIRKACYKSWCICCWSQGWTCIHVDRINDSLWILDFWCFISTSRSTSEISVLWVGSLGSGDLSTIPIMPIIFRKSWR